MVLCNEDFIYKSLRSGLIRRVIFMNNIIETQEGIFEFDSPQKISTELWANEHLDCNAIIDDLGSYIVVCAFTRDPKYNYALTKYKKEKNYTKQFILRGISSDGLNSLL